MSHTPVHPERPRVAVPCAATLGEAPMWDARTGTLYWVDIKGHRVWRWAPGGGQEAAWLDVGQQVAFVKLTPNPDMFVLGLKSGLARLDGWKAPPTIVLRHEPDRPGNRLNDAGVGPDGSLYFGSMDDAEAHPTGAFYRWTTSGLHRFGYPATVTNGPTVDGIRRVIYTADTLNNLVYRHAMDDGGVPDDGQVFVRFEEGVGHPDGITVDADGCIWVCHFGGGRVTRFSQDGEPLLIVTVPTGKVTKVAFGGRDLGTMYITTAAIGQDRTVDLQAGNLFAIETGIKGLAAEFCTMVA